MAYQPPVLSGLVGSAAMAPGGFTLPQPSTSVTDLSEHYSGMKGSSHTTLAADAETKRTLMIAAGIVLGALVLLWLLGGITFRSIRA